MLNAIDLETVCYLIIKMRELSVKMAPEDPMRGDNPTDDDEREILFSYPDDPTEEEIQKTIATLNEDASVELFALVLLGRGDFVDWQSALDAARQDPDLRTPHALTGIPLVATYLEDGLTQLGYSCADVEGDRL
jgi:Protein of unknown function (DUF3775)